MGLPQYKQQLEDINTTARKELLFRVTKTHFRPHPPFAPPILHLESSGRNKRESEGGAAFLVRPSTSAIGCEALGLRPTGCACARLRAIATQENTMKDTDIKKLLYTHLLCIFSIILSIFIPSFFLENFSILETHLTWLCICSVSVTAVNLVLYLVLKPNVSSKRSSLSYKVTRFLKCCIYFLTSCFFFHVIFVLYGAPLIELALETFSLAVILSTFTTVPCLCLLGPNFKAWLRIFSRNG
ncbi:PIGF [Cervus elaphus hippelaphus]|uniref:PIGF n=1 Tax=Cervus elaphus hippelaphus TaxID=46360 RepID=A0A212CXN4_CEREH|nr:PIGF [Cervus elaphus hippelaphus]